MNDDGFVVARPVMVDLSKVSNQKKFAVDRDPDSISIFSGEACTTYAHRYPQGKLISNLIQDRAKISNLPTHKSPNCYFF